MRQDQVFEWRFVTHVVHAQLNEKYVVCMLVHCWVSGALSPFLCLTMSLADTYCVGEVWLGCCVRTV